MQVQRAYHYYVYGILWFTENNGKIQYDIFLINISHTRNFELLEFCDYGLYLSEAKTRTIKVTTLHIIEAFKLGHITAY